MAIKNRTKDILLVLVIVSATAFLAGGCRKDPPMVTILDPEQIKEFALEWPLCQANPGKTISSDGRYLLTTLKTDSEETMAVFPLEEEGDPIPLYSVDIAWTQQNLVQWYSVGWLSDNQPVFLVHGWQHRGEHEGERGTALFIGDLENGLSETKAFFPVPTQGETVEEAFLTQEGKILLHVSHSYWEYDTKTGNKTLLSEGFTPTYGGIAMSALSPKGDKVVYSIYEDDKNGVFLLDVHAGEEIEILPSGDSLSFFPTWSPDGKYLFTYTLNKKESIGDQNSTRFDFVYRMEGITPAADKLTVLDAQGRIVKLIESEDSYISNAAWLHDSETLFYATAPVKFGKWGELLSFGYENVCIEKTDGQALPSIVAQVKDIEKETGEPSEHIFIATSLSYSDGAVISIVGSNNSSLWRVQEDMQPLKLSDGWWDTTRMTPVFLDKVAGLVTERDVNRLYLVGPEEIVEVGEPSPNQRTILDYNGDTLIILENTFENTDAKLKVYKMLEKKLGYATLFRTRS